ncbi:uncharacterized protein E0L32_010653 [Thyridium curvatum]|uniref:Phosphatidylglycerol/phosphatidylinositol transfer protein n=1 Tax=Thyridium curvatum TaxID=1093900 RepID=A0A507AEF6_9PEZI|nr:uncharacterized protein E0L32_010653 [Thyridium curvatum]TPX07655.1 hypothetical protein E0L32_010653 [Thyridium curvatum]
MKYGIAIAALLSTAQGLSFFGNDAVTANEDLKVPGDSPLELCDKDHSDDLVDITRVDLLPNPPEAYVSPLGILDRVRSYVDIDTNLSLLESSGADLVIKATGTVFETIEEGAYVNLSVKYGLIRLISTTADLCEQIQNVDLKCPIEKGILSITKSVELPKEIPPGKYTVLADVYDKDDKPITCLTAQVVFGRKDKSAKSTPLEIEL